MLVDDPVKRVDNMTMAWGLEARVPFLDHEVVELAATCPPGTQVGLRWQGRARGPSGRGARGSDRPDEGLLPGARDPSADGEVLYIERDALTNDPARARGLFRAETVEALLAEPNDTRTTLGANALWQLALLEMWLQSMEG